VTLERLLRVWVVLVYAFMYMPVAVIAVFSFNDSDMIAFPLQGFTWTWYADVLSDRRFLGGFWTTLTIAFPTALIATALGGLAALAIARYQFRWKLVFIVLLLIPFLIPRIIFAVAQLLLLSELDIERSVATIIAAQVLIILPFTALIITSVLIRLDSRLEEAAADLGASAWQTFLRVQLPLMRNGLIAAAFIAMVLSSGEYVVTAFLSGRVQPLSVMVASDFRFSLSPSLNALATLVVLANCLVIVVSESIRWRARRAATGAG
jgi:spermidine/putrescine transport system permease protein